MDPHPSPYTQVTSTRQAECWLARIYIVDSWGARVTPNVISPNEIRRVIQSSDLRQKITPPMAIRISEEMLMSRIISPIELPNRSANRELSMTYPLIEGSGCCRYVWTNVSGSINQRAYSMLAVTKSPTEKVTSTAHSVRARVSRRPCRRVRVAPDWGELP